MVIRTVSSLKLVVKSKVSLSATRAMLSGIVWPQVMGAAQLEAVADTKVRCRS